MSEDSSLVLGKPVRHHYERKRTHVIIFILCLQSEGYFLESTDFTPIPMLIFRIITGLSDDRTASHRSDSLTTGRQSSQHGAEDRARQLQLACHQFDSTGGKNPVLVSFH